jgi:hypothetical protein
MGVVGRPKSGRKVFRQEQIDKLKVEGNTRSVALALGVRIYTVQTWLKLEENPLPHYTKTNGSVLIKRRDLVKWLAATRRFTIKPEYNKPPKIVL